MDRAARPNSRRCELPYTAFPSFYQLVGDQELISAESTILPRHIRQIPIGYSNTHYRSFKGQDHIIVDNEYEDI